MNIGVIGYNRGKKLINLINKTDINFSVTAIFDPFIKKKIKNIKIFKNENDFYKYGNFKNVYISSPVKFHFKQTLNAIKNNKNILCEVPAFKNISDGKKIKQALKGKKIIYNLAENFLFIPQYIALEKLIRKNYFGEILYLRSGYIHDCKKLCFIKNKTLTWRGLERLKKSGNDYPTHSIAPICNFLNISKQNTNDKLKFIQTYATKEKAISEFVKEKKINIKNLKFARSDISLSKIETKRKIIIDLICDTSSNRPSSMIDLYIQGSKGAYISGRYDGEDPIIFNTKNRTFKKFNYKKYLSKKDKKNFNKLKRLFPFYKTLKQFENNIKKKNAKNILNFNNAYLWSSIIEKSKLSLIFQKKMRLLEL